MSDLWRYPVKSFQGERERRLFLTPLGFLGDRRVAVLDVNRQEVLTATRAPVLLAYRAVCLDSIRGAEVGVQMPDGRHVRWDDPVLAADISHHLEREVRVLASPMAVREGPPVHLISEASLQQMAEWTNEDVDRRRFRANLIIDTDDSAAFAENEWPGYRLHVGDDVVIDVLERTRRSRVAGYDPDTLERDTSVHATIARRLDNHIGVSCRVVRGGWMQVGDRVSLTPTPTSTISRSGGAKSPGDSAGS